MTKKIKVTVESRFSVDVSLLATDPISDPDSVVAIIDPITQSCIYVRISTTSIKLI